MASQPLPYRPHVLAKNERNEAMIADYLGGMSRAEVARKYGLHIGRLGKLLYQQRILLPVEERERRKRLTESPGRSAVWPDCPEHLRADYEMFRFRKRIPAAQARAMLDPGFRA
jgi:transposase